MFGDFASAGTDKARHAATNETKQAVRPARREPPRSAPEKAFTPSTNLASTHACRPGTGASQSGTPAGL
jgi:hypothetical protein